MTMDVTADEPARNAVRSLKDRLSALAPDGHADGGSSSEGRADDGSAGGQSDCVSSVGSAADGTAGETVRGPSGGSTAEKCAGLLSLGADDDGSYAYNVACDATFAEHVQKVSAHGLRGGHAMQLGALSASAVDGNTVAFALQRHVLTAEGTETRVQLTADRLLRPHSDPFDTALIKGVADLKRWLRSLPKREAMALARNWGVLGIGFHWGTTYHLLNTMPPPPRAAAAAAAAAAGDSDTAQTTTRGPVAQLADPDPVVAIEAHSGPLGEPLKAWENGWPFGEPGARWRPDRAPGLRLSRPRKAGVSQAELGRRLFFASRALHCSEILMPFTEQDETAVTAFQPRAFSEGPTALDTELPADGFAWAVLPLDVIEHDVTTSEQDVANARRKRRGRLTAKHRAALLSKIEQNSRLASGRGRAGRYEGHTPPAAFFEERFEVARPERAAAFWASVRAQHAAVIAKRTAAGAPFVSYPVGGAKGWVYGKWEKDVLWGHHEPVAARKAAARRAQLDKHFSDWSPSRARDGRGRLHRSSHQRRYPRWH